jgi:hypothetical protein
MNKAIINLASTMGVILFSFMALGCNDGDKTNNSTSSPEALEVETIDGVYTDHRGDFKSTVSISGSSFTWESTMYGQQQATTYGKVVNNTIFDESGFIKIGSINPQRRTVSLNSALGTVTCSK